MLAAIEIGLRRRDDSGPVPENYQFSVMVKGISYSFMDLVDLFSKVDIYPDECNYVLSKLDLLENHIDRFWKYLENSEKLTPKEENALNYLSVWLKDISDKIESIAETIRTSTTAFVICTVEKYLCRGKIRLFRFLPVNSAKNLIAPIETPAFTIIIPSDASQTMNV